MNNCPHCNRRLISHISPRCNWCGKEIEDAVYQAQAETDRAAFFAQQAIHDAQSLMRTEAILTGVNPLGVNPMFGLPQFPGVRGGVMSRSARQRAAAQEMAVAEAQLNAINNAPPSPSFGTALSSAQPPANDQAAVDAAYQAAQEAQRATAQRYSEPPQPTPQYAEPEPRPWYAAPAARTTDVSGTPEQRSDQQRTDDLPGPQETTPEHTQNRFQTLEW